MTVRATKFTPEVLLSAPRRSAGVPDAFADKILYTVSTHDFNSHKETTELRVLDAFSQESTLLTTADGIREPHWLGADVLFLAPGEQGKTLVKIARLDDFEGSAYVAGEVNAAAGNVRVKLLSDGSYALALSAPADPHGDLYNPEEAPEAHTSGRVYDAMYVRHWDHWRTASRDTLWYGALRPTEGETPTYALTPLVNALRGTELECPIPPFGGTDCFDISEAGGIILVAKDPALNEAFNTKCNVYLVPLESWTQEHPPAPRQAAVGGFEGACASPVFSPDGKKAAFLAMRENGYESDKNHIFVIPDVERPGWVDHLLGSPDGKGLWDRSPSSVVFSTTGEELYPVAEDEGSVCLWVLPSDPMKATEPPQLLLRKGSVSSIKPLSKEKLFVSTTSIVDNSTYYMVQSWPDPVVSVISSNSRNGAAFGLSPDQVSPFWFDGAAQRVHAWVVKPSTFTAAESYPLALLIHGGPQGAWNDSWSTRWNPAVFAEQGYVVVCPNPTGSTGYGQAFTDAIKEQWGGLPYDDIVKCVDAVQREMPFVDCGRAVALGASYGGYMANWIQGMPLGRRLRALVSHDGIFSIPAAQLASDEQFFAEHDLGGPWWENPAGWRRWDPAQHVGRWATPQLVIHSARDYRLCISEGLATFGALQAKGVESRLLTFPDENHWVLKPENSLLWHTTVLDWINGHVGLPPYGDKGKPKETAEQARLGLAQPKKTEK